MRRLLLLASAASAMLVLCLSSGTAQAQYSFISGTGDDSNPCTRALPCQSWSGALSKSEAGGEIDALDGGNFGFVTINKAITLDGGGQAGVIVAFDGFNVITVNAGTGDVVTLRNLRINGIAQAAIPGLNGILIEQAGVVHIENCNIYGFPKNEIVAKTSATLTKLIINDTTISDSLNGVQLGPTSGQLAATFERVRIHNNSNAGVFLNPSGAGVVGINLSRSAVTFNGTGLLVEPNGEVALNDTEVIENATAATVVSGGLVVSYGNNVISGPTTGTPFASAALR